MATSSEMTPQDLSPNQLSSVLSQTADSSLVETIQQTKNDLVTLLTLKIRRVNQLMTDLGLPLSYFSSLQATSTPVHPEVAQELLRWANGNKQEHADALLAQDFVPNEKLHKLIKSMCKSGHSNSAHALLAMDGLGGKLSQVPNTDPKKYIENLKYSLSGEQGSYDREANDDWKRAHAVAVRKVYQELDKQRTGDSKLALGVYRVMRLILNEVGGIGLPCKEEEEWSEEALASGVQTYKENMKEEYLNRFMEMMKTRVMNLCNDNTSNGSDEDEGSPAKRQKTK